MKTEKAISATFVPWNNAQTINQNNVVVADRNELLKMMGRNKDKE